MNLIVNIIIIINVSGLNKAKCVLLLLHRELINIFNLLEEMDINYYCRLNDSERHDFFVY